MFRQTKNIDTAFRQMRQFTFVIIFGCCFITAYGLYIANKSITESGKRIYILANGKALEAFAGDRKDNIPVEARDHIKTFHQYFFTLAPDDKVIQANLAKALYLADGSAKEQYDNLKENSYYSNIISGNISQEVETDSVRVDINQYPFYFRFYGKEKIIRPVSIVTRSLITEGFLRNVSRSDNNPHGFLIEKWKTLENKDIKTVAR
ncbi:MAG: conjugative transposon protein TraK [Bacteroidetes bacterium]|nr:conjugative transposon protein TraK [Bacteroidota bacterium]